MEETQSKNIADAAKAAGAFLIWSTLPSILEMSNGKLTKAALYEGKAAVDKYTKELGIPCAYFFPAPYMDLFKSFYAPKKVSDVCLLVFQCFFLLRDQEIYLP